MNIIFALVFSAHALQVWEIPMMNCTDCTNKVKHAVSNIDGFEIRAISQRKTQICFEGDTVSFAAKLKDLGYAVTDKKTVDNCPKVEKTPWETYSQKVKIVSTGEEFNYQDHLVAGEYTLFDYGAAWCGPCYSATDRIKAVLAKRTDLSVRVIDLEGEMEKAFDLPVARQHLAFAAGIPWLVLFDPKGKKVYEGPLVGEALGKLP